MTTLAEAQLGGAKAKVQNAKITERDTWKDYDRAKKMTEAYQQDVDYWQRIVDLEKTDAEEPRSES